MDSHEIVRVTSPQINAAGAAFYFHPDTLAAGKELGLDGFRFYVAGRGGVLGDVEPAVVASAFGYFHGDLVAKMWRSACQIVPPRRAATAYLGAADRFGRAHLAELEGLDSFVDAAELVIAGTDGAALALFAGVAAEPLPDDAPARAYRHVVTLRELRGSVHLLAIVAEGLSPAVAHAIRRPDDVTSFGYAEPPAVTSDDRRRLDAADERTDDLLVPAVDRLTDDQRAAFAAGTAAIAAAI